MCAVDALRLKEFTNTMEYVKHLRVVLKENSL